MKKGYRIFVASFALAAMWLLLNESQATRKVAAGGTPANVASMMTTLTVDSPGDTADVAPGDGVCNDGSGNCTLRAAIQEANALAGTDTINFNIPNLLLNPSGDEPLAGGEVPNWTEAVGSVWTVNGGSGSGEPLPFSGPSKFYAGDVANAELRQDVDVSAYATAIDAGSQAFEFRGYVRSFTQSPADLSRIIIEYRDAANTMALSTFDSGEIGITSAWQLVQDTRNAPAGSRWIRVRLIARRVNGTDNNGYFDALSLRPVGQTGASSAIPTLVPLTALPTITAPVVINGMTQPNGRVELNGSHAGAAVNGLVISAGSSHVRGLVINRFTDNGISVTTNGGNIIAGNFIGTDTTGTLDRGNTDNGVLLQSSGNTVGGSSATDRNVISGNTLDGVRITGDAADSNTVAGNYIGTDASGTVSVANAQNGVNILTSADNNLIGGSTTTPGTAPGNIISGNTGDGIEINGSATTGNLVQGNVIGLQAGGAAARGNGGDGVLITAGASSNTIGGTASGLRNIISGNGVSGVQIFGPVTAANANVIAGNYIGTDITGAVDLGNTGNGVTLNSDGGSTPNVIGGAANTTFGGACTGGCNLISGNNADGIRALSNSSLAVIQGNYIGTNANGTAAIPNSQSGVSLDGTGGANFVRAYTIGGATSGEGNIISGNLAHGIELVSNSRQHTVLGNRIGTNAAGTAALPNGNDGIFLNGNNGGGSLGNTIGSPTNTTPGGGCTGGCNLISGNGDSTGDRGIDISGNNAGDNLIQGNYVGVDVSGSAALANFDDGLLIANGADNNIIGGTTVAERNIIAGNGGDGIEINGNTTTPNTVQGNFIGVQTDGATARGNGGHGVFITASAPGNIIGGAATGAGNTIAFNTGDGVYVDSGTGNAIRRNLIHSNSGMGIDLGADNPTANDPSPASCPADADIGANNLQNFPLIHSVSITPTNTVIHGTLYSVASQTYTLDFYANPSCDNSGYGEGRTYIGSAMVTTNAGCVADFSGANAVTLPAAVPPGSIITATATDATNNTSEFSSCSSPTAVDFVQLVAYGNQDGVMLRWQTGYEVNNLGFRIYREAAGEQKLITPDPIAGSALLAGAGTVLTAGRDYTWQDTAMTDCRSPVGDCQSTRYWLEDLDLDGTSTWHGPFYVQPPQDDNDATENLSRNSRRLDEISDDHKERKATSVVEPAASAAQMTKAITSQAVSTATAGAIKLCVKREGWYRVEQSELVSAGLAADVDPHRIQLSVDGKELPIHISGEEDGRFDTGDAVEFYGLGLNLPATDTRLYWLAVGTKAGQRLKKAAPGKGYSSRESFSQTVERRDRTIYFSALRNGEAENFFGAVVAANAVSQTITIKKAVLTSPIDATLEVALQGVTQQAHQVKVSLNDAFLGYVNFAAQGRAVERFTVNHSLLREGANIITLQSLNGQGDVNLVDFLRLTYQRAFVADNDTLRLTAQDGEWVRVGGFLNKDLRAFDITDERDVRQLDVEIEETEGGYAARFTANGKGERRLLVQSNGSTDRVAGIKADTPSTLRADAGADFLIVTHGSLRDAFMPLAALRTGQGLQTAVIDVEDIYDEFNAGHKAPAAIKDFLAHALKHWKVKPQFVMLAGEASYDARNYLGVGERDLVPTRLVDTTLLETASDDWFADFNGDGAADVAIGRLPVRTIEEAETSVRKLVLYESSTSSNEVLLVADRNDGFNFEQATTNLRSLVPPGVHVGEVFRSGAGDATARNHIFAAIARGQKIVNYAGHGSVGLWRGSLLTSNDARLFTNGDRLPLFVMMTCLNGYFHDAAADSLAEALVKAEHGGAVAAWASSGLTPPHEQAAMNQQLYRLLFQEKLSLGEAARRAKAAATDSDVRQTWVLLGDPTLILR